MRNATVIPNGRDNTYDPTEVSRRTADEHYENSFSEDERTGLESKFSGGSSGGNAGYECTETYQTVYEGSVTTEPDVDVGYAEIEGYSLTAEFARITINGVSYTVERKYNSENDFYYYGDDGGWNSEYPFSIDDNGTSIGFLVPSAESATYALKIESVDYDVETTPCFKQAVRSMLPKRLGIRTFGEHGSLELLEGSYQMLTEIFETNDFVDGYWFRWESSFDRGNIETISQGENYFQFEIQGHYVRLFEDNTLQWTD